MKKNEFIKKRISELLADGNQYSTYDIRDYVIDKAKGTEFEDKIWRENISTCLQSLQTITPRYERVNRGVYRIRPEYLHGRQTVHNSNIVTGNENMTFFENEMRRIFGDSKLVTKDTKFYNKTLLSKISDELLAKIEISEFGYSNHYEGLRLSIINNKDGVIDRQAFKFVDIIGMRSQCKPYIYDFGKGDVRWYWYTPNSEELKQIRTEVEEYVSMFFDQEMSDNVITFGGG